MGHTSQHAKFARTSQVVRAKLALHNAVPMRETCGMREWGRKCVEWLQKGLQKPGKSQLELAQVLRIDPSAISKMVAGKRRILAGELLEMAKYLEEPVPGDTPKNDAAFIRSRGKIAANVWREADTAQGEARAVPIPRDPRYPHVEQYAFEVEGDSMNKVAKDGWTILCVPYFEARRALTQGDLVHVERRRDGGDLENSLKRIRIGKDGPELWPESTNPKHQKPIPVANSEGYEVEVMGLVIGVYNPNP